MRIGRPGNRSSLLSHTFPPFYACYLLKSVQTATSRATYIGSTPNPPRRIRQHNGELTQGAWKTKSGRPWVMQMIVHGFPSKLAALQFEWAWQHPNVARHIRDTNGRVFSGKGRSLKQNIQILRFMISIHPYNLWPLHVKIFTSQALKVWEELLNVEKAPKGKGKEKASSVRTTTLPPGFTYTVELEGVDGKSIAAGRSRRTEPIEVQDEEFVMAHLNKNIDLLASKSNLNCSVCQEPLTGYSSEPLTHALCPHHTCTATAHLLCLSQHFLLQGGPDLPLVPRGGSCPTCSNYVLWGDVVKGCYRRASGGAVSVEEEEEALDRMYNSDNLTGSTSNVSGSKHQNPAKRVISPRKRREKEGECSESSSSEGEEFDFQEVEDRHYSDESEVWQRARVAVGRLSPSKLKIDKEEVMLPVPLIPSMGSPTRFRKPKVVSSSTSTPKKRKALRTRVDQESSEGELFEFDAIEDLPSTDEDAPKRKISRPGKHLNVEKTSISLLNHPTGIAKRGGPRKVGLRAEHSNSGAVKTLSTMSEGCHDNSKKISSSSKYIYTLPLFESDEDTEAEHFRQKGVLVKSMSSLSITSPSSS
ncbi:hypothetical protein GYMLUDRAFT_67571 [Collybiopsis luxurians FD-317 M1]|nr:hypothetical protein GYMLUDRAFT_67571 [Collybiopsis luxurians FD-317 M1]